jgi:hypothetical protein
MHVLKITAPQGAGEEVAKLALKVGIQEASVSEVYVHGPNQQKDSVEIETDTPTAKAFLDALLTAKFFNPEDFSISSQTVPSLVSSSLISKLTRSFNMPVTDVQQDLWLRNQINPAFLARASVSALLVAYGLIQNDLITLIAAFLFTPFLSQVLAIGFGSVTREWRLAAQGALVLSISTVITIIAGVIVASLTGGPLKFDNFSSILVNFLISLIVGVVAGLSTADISGRRELIAFAAAAQFAVYPAWLGIMFVLGLPGAGVVTQRIVTFLVNIGTILVVSAGVYFAMRYNGDALRSYLKTE